MENSRAARRMRLEDYVRAINDVYSINDQKRSLWDVWCHTLHHAGSVVEIVRKKGKSSDLFREIADFALWLFTMVHKLEGPVAEPKTVTESAPESLIRIRAGASDVIWHKYPDLCPTCYMRRTDNGRVGRNADDLIEPCDCLLYNASSVARNSWRKSMSALREFSDTRTANRPSDIDNWQVMFGRVFSANLRRLTLAEIALHLMEELGETSDALIRMYSYKATDFLAGEPDWHQFRLESQIADVFSQLFGLAEKINLLRNDAYVDGCQLLETQSPSYTPLHLSDIIWSRYGCSEHDSLCCPFCKNAICRCEIILVPATRPTAELLERFENPSRTV